MIFDWVEFLVLEGTVIWWIGVLLISLHKPKYKLNYQSLFANVSPRILDSKNGRNLHIGEIGNQYSLLIKANSFITIQPIIKEKVNSQRSIEFKLLDGFFTWPFRFVVLILKQVQTALKQVVTRLNNVVYVGSVCGRNSVELNIRHDILD